MLYLIDTEAIFIYTYNRLFLPKDITPMRE